LEAKALHSKELYKIANFVSVPRWGKRWGIDV